MWTRRSAYRRVSALSAVPLPLVWTAGCERRPEPQPGGVCDRTPEVRDAIVRGVPGVFRCEEITAEDLSWIGVLAMRHINELREGDFAGMIRLKYLNVVDGRLATLPEGIFARLSNLVFL